MIKIIFLGTADQIPSARRNHFSAWLNYKDENILVDCGEGTQRQIRKANLNPCKLTRILITHWHADHVLGLPGLLSTLATSGYNKKMQIYGPKGTTKKILEMLKLFNFHREYEIEVQEVNETFFQTEKFSLSAKEMSHKIPCNAYSFSTHDQLRIDKEKLKKFKISPGPILSEIKKGKNATINGKKYLSKDLTYLEKGKKISFILDTSLNKNIDALAKNSDLLVIESTYVDELKEQAKENSHLTAKQVGKIAKKSKVKKLALVHISQRYEAETDKVLKEAKEEFEGETIIPKDLDSIEI